MVSLYFTAVLLLYHYLLLLISSSRCVLCIYRHHDNPFVFGEPHPQEPKYKERHANHLRYVQQYESIKWFLEGIEHGPKIFNWGR